MMMSTKEDTVHRRGYQHLGVPGQPQMARVSDTTMGPPAQILSPDPSLSFLQGQIIGFALGKDVDTFLNSLEGKKHKQAFKMQKEMCCLFIYLF